MESSKSSSIPFSWKTDSNIQDSPSFVALLEEEKENLLLSDTQIDSSLYSTPYPGYPDQNLPASTSSSSPPLGFYFLEDPSTRREVNNYSQSEDQLVQKLSLSVHTDHDDLSQEDDEVDDEKQSAENLLYGEDSLSKKGYAVDSMTPNLLSKRLGGVSSLSLIQPIFSRKRYIGNKQHSPLPILNENLIFSKYQFVVRPIFSNDPWEFIWSLKSHPPWQAVLAVLISTFHMYEEVQTLSSTSLEVDKMIVKHPRATLPSCSICLSDTVLCPRLTACGHIFCYPCILRYLDQPVLESRGSRFEETCSADRWRKCPLCYNYIQKKDLKPCVYLMHQPLDIFKQSFLPSSITEYYIFQFLCVAEFGCLSPCLPTDNIIVDPLPLLLTANPQETLRSRYYTAGSDTTGESLPILEEIYERDTISLLSKWDEISSLSDSASIEEVEMIQSTLLDLHNFYSKKKAHFLAQDITKLMDLSPIVTSTKIFKYFFQDIYSRNLFLDETSTNHLTSYFLKPPNCGEVFAIANGIFVDVTKKLVFVPKIEKFREAKKHNELWHLPHLQDSTPLSNIVLCSLSLSSD